MTPKDREFLMGLRRQAQELAEGVAKADTLGYSVTIAFADGKITKFDVRGRVDLDSKLN